MRAGDGHFQEISFEHKREKRSEELPENLEKRGARLKVFRLGAGAFV